MGPLLDRPWLWHLNRNAIAKGLAIGMFFGMLVPIGQALVAGVAAIGLRANLPAAVLATFVSNPLTTPAILLAAYHAGSAILGEATALPKLADGAGWLAEIGAMGEPLLLGLALFALGGAAIAYFGVQIAWRLAIAWHLATRRARARALG
ncbi:MAG: DUF2062 domain-containing protein [Burkholderiales bacterium]|nr:DUF2062 domain-containing protein [Burkholderiales bacterium]